MEITQRNSAKRKERITYEQAFSLNGKTPPQAVELEEAVLGALMLDQNALNNTIQMLRTEYFYKPEHQRIFKAILTLFEQSKPVDLLTVTQQLMKDGQLEEVGGAMYLSQLTNRVVSAAHIEFHSRILSEKYIQREIIRVCTETLTEAYDETTDVLDLLDKTERVLMDIDEKNFHSEYHNMQDVLHTAFEQIEAAQQSDNSYSGIPTGFVDLDRMTAGFQAGTLIILAARPAMGKTAFALTMARNIAVDMKMPIAFFSLEMTAVELVMRLISSESGISGDRLKKGEKLPEVEKTQLYAKSQILTEAPIYIDDTPQLSIFELRAKCRRLKQQHGIKAVFIDYLQLMQAGGEQSRNGNREQEISLISRQLKALSKELGVPVIALSQLSRAVETRGGTKKPQLSDLRESGAIEQDADIVMFIYRPEYYRIFEDDAGSTLGMADIIVAKHRSGETGEVRLRFVAQYAKFENRESEGRYNMATGLQPNTDFDNGGAVILESKMNRDIDNTSNAENEGMFQ
ncbi:MAG: replicative DNA helicase [Bacteroidales bacterium]|nr:replicative DNA helicase [Bacteroidales bacterium]